ncbi:MAG: S8 family peptidase, partial [Trebonia sp.]
HGVLLIAPAGDDGAKGNVINYPAAYPGIVAVGATTRTGQLSPFSNTRSYITLTAPGAGITPDPAVSAGMTADPAAGLTVAAPDGGYQPLASTDMSAALTAGVAALIRSRYPSLTVPEVTQALEHGATAPPAGARSAKGGPADAGWGHGQLDAAAALSSAAAIAAAHQATAPSAAPTTAPTVRRASTGTVRQTEAGPADPGHLLRSLVVDLAAAAGVLIACLIGALALTARRRRARVSRSAPAARHARGQPALPTAPIPARVVIWPPAPATPQLGGNRRRLPSGDPPWQPAPPPRVPASPPAMLPAQTATEKPSPPLAPWEESPEEFAVAPIVDDPAPWPVSSTGPMYVWNPTSATGPMIAVNGEEEGAD